MSRRRVTVQLTFFIIIFFINIFMDYIQYKIPQDALHNNDQLTFCNVHLTWQCPVDVALSNRQSHTSHIVIQTQKCEPYQLNKLSSHPLLRGAYHLTQPHPHVRKRKHGRILPSCPGQQQPSFTSYPKHNERV